MSTPVTTETPAELGTAARLRAATAIEHSSAESRGFMVDLMGGTLGLAEYTRYLAQFVRVYEALEARIPTAGDPAHLHDTRVHRAESARADLVALGAPDWRSDIPALGATTRYVDHLSGFGPEDGLLHLAHHYTRYLGDLSGGQVMATMLRRHYSARDEQLTFFDFGRIDNLVHYKRAYRAGLDELVLDDAQLETLLAEARLAFDLSSGIFDDLGETQAGRAIRTS